MIRKRIPIEWHEETGKEVRQAYGLLVSTFVKVANTYGKTSKEAAYLDKAIKALDAAKNLLDYGAPSHCYYGPPEKAFLEEPLGS